MKEVKKYTAVSKNTSVTEEVFQRQPSVKTSSSGLRCPSSYHCHIGLEKLSANINFLVGAQMAVSL